jgi:hypothetical protein
LGKIGAADKRVLPALIKGLDDEATLGDAAAALGDMGPAAAEALPALLKKSKELAEKRTVKSPQDFWAPTGSSKLSAASAGRPFDILGSCAGTSTASCQRGLRKHSSKSVPGLMRPFRHSSRP